MGDQSVWLRGALLHRYILRPRPCTSVLGRCKGVVGHRQEPNFVTQPAIAWTPSGPSERDRPYGSRWYARDTESPGAMKAARCLCASAIGDSRDFKPGGGLGNNVTADQGMKRWTARTRIPCGPLPGPVVELREQQGANVWLRLTRTLRCQRMCLEPTGQLYHAEEGVGVWKWQFTDPWPVVS